MEELKTIRLADGRLMYTDDRGNIYSPMSPIIGYSSNALAGGDGDIWSSIISGAASLIGNLFSARRAKLLALKEQTGQLAEVENQLKQENAQLDIEINNVRRAISTLKGGLFGIELTGIWKTSDRQKELDRVDNFNARITVLKTEQAEKIALLQQLSSEYEQLVAQDQQAGIGWLAALLLFSAISGTAYVAWKKNKKKAKLVEENS